MTTLRYPALVWEEGPGLAFACLLREDGPLTTGGRSTTEALKRARRRLKRAAKRRRFVPDPELDRVELHLVKVAIRPEHRLDGKVHPCAEEVVLRIPCVTAERPSGLHVAFLPTLAHLFLWSPGEQSREELVVHYAREALRGRSPRELARHLGPREPRLESLAVNLPRKERGLGPGEDLPLLRSVAEPLGRAGGLALARPLAREEEVAALAAKLKDSRASLVLVGEAGAGKTVLLGAAARVLEREREADPGDLPGQPLPPRLWLTSAQRLIAGMRYLGQWEERLESVVAELAAVDGVLCLEDLREALVTGGRGPSNSVLAFLLPFVLAGELRLVAEVSPAGLDAARRHLPGLVDALEPFPVRPLDRSATLEVLRRLAEGSARDQKVLVERGTVETIERLFRRFSPYRAPPGPQTDLLRTLVEEAVRGRRERIGPGEAIAAFVRRTGLPSLLLEDALPLPVAEVKDALAKQVIGQDPAVAVAAGAVVAFKAGLNDPERPLATFLFCGPTGVGKTALARALASWLFGHGAGADDRLVRLDMSEYAGPDAATRLLGEPDGPPSELVKRVRRQPFVVLLLDEIEKAAPEVLDVLLGLLDEGRLTDPWGRVTWFTSALIVLTSNLGAGAEEALGFAEAAPGRDPGAPSGRHADAVRAHFRPELWNRLDAVVPFAPLPPAVVRQVAEKELRELSKREGLARLGLGLVWSEDVVDLLAREGFDRRFGARPLQRCLEERVVAPIARWLAANPAPRPGRLRVEVGPDGSIEVAHP